MAYVIGDACVNCGTCADACPLGIISGRFVCCPERAELFPDGDFTLTADDKTLRGLGRLRFWGCAFPLGIV